MATYAHGNRLGLTFFDMNDFSKHLFNEHLQLCFSKEMQIPEEEEIELFVTTGESSPEMERFVKAMREVAEEFNEMTYQLLDAEAMRETMPEDMPDELE